MERAKELACQLFEQLGFSSEAIPETDKKRADLDVNDGDQQYIIEVKEKRDTGSQLTVLEGLGGPDLPQVTREPHAASNRLDGILKDGRKQLAETPADGNAIRMLFVAFFGPNASMFARRTLYTFYGLQDVVPASGGDGVNCVYFHNSFSFSSPDVDGLLILEHDGVQLCLNEFSSRCDVLRKSKLAVAMGSAIYDPKDFDGDNGKLVLRSDISRKNEAAVLDDLERITGVKYTTVKMHRYTI